MLQYILNDEGRARPVIPDGGTGQTKFVYDYFLKDHLGNVRSVVTAEPVSPRYLAKHEIASANIENLFFDNIPAFRGNKPGSTNPEDTKAALLNASDPNRIIGTTLMLRVMPGDKFTISADAYYDGNNNGKGDHLPAEEIINQLFGTLLQGANYENIPLKELPDNVRTISEVLGGRGLPEAINDMLDATDDPTLPRAHLNYLIFDDKMNLDTKVSGAVQVPMGGGSWGSLSPSHQIGILTPGYILIYVDNQSIGKDVWFDNIHVEHYTGKVLEQNHYYPFGLTIAQDGAATTTEQPYKYNGKELVKAFGLESYDYGARIFDPQIGRWKGVDPKAAKGPNYSPYAFCFDNPIILFDPDGAWPHKVHIRSFAPFKTFGGGFAGDDRGYSTSLKVTSRLQHAFTVDPTARTFNAGNVWSNESSHPILGTGNATPNDKADIRGFTSSSDKNGNSTVSFTADMAGANPLVSGSPDIDVHTKFTLTENEKAGTLKVNAVQTGDAYPSAETFIGDTKGNQLFIGVSPAIGNPYTSLPGDGSKKMMSANFTVTMDSKGVFIGVVVGSGKDAKTYSVSDWNKMMQQKPTTK